jgi:hypothetical protein
VRDHQERDYRHAPPGYQGEPQDGLEGTERRHEPVGGDEWRGTRNQITDGSRISDLQDAEPEEDNAQRNPQQREADPGEDVEQT